MPGHKPSRKNRGKKQKTASNSQNRGNSQANSNTSKSAALAAELNQQVNPLQDQLKQNQSSEMPKSNPGFQVYSLDKYAHDLVIVKVSLTLSDKDKSNVFNEVFKMRSTIAFGIERFWGEPLRLQGDGSNKNLAKAKAQYWEEVWNIFKDIMNEAEISLPKSSLSISKGELKDTVDAIWNMSIENRKVSISVLTSLCDCMIWWTQRYK
jgi:hypothetical protein